MKEIIILIVALVALSFMAEANTGRYFPNVKNTQGGFYDGKAMFAYTQYDISHIKKDEEVEVLTNVAATQACADPEINNLIKNMGLKIIYIYISKKNDGVVFVTVDKCKE